MVTDELRLQEGNTLLAGMRLAVREEVAEQTRALLDSLRQQNQWLRPHLEEMHQLLTQHLEGLRWGSPNGSSSVRRRSGSNQPATSRQVLMRAPSLNLRQQDLETELVGAPICEAARQVRPQEFEAATTAPLPPCSPLGQPTPLALATRAAPPALEDAEELQRERRSGSSVKSLLPNPLGVPGVPGTQDLTPLGSEAPPQASFQTVVSDIVSSMDSSGPDSHEVDVLAAPFQRNGTSRREPRPVLEGRSSTASLSPSGASVRVDTSPRAGRSSARDAFPDVMRSFKVKTVEVLDEMMMDTLLEAEGYMQAPKSKPRTSCGAGGRPSLSKLHAVVSMEPEAPALVEGSQSLPSFAIKAEQGGEAADKVLAVVRRKSTPRVSHPMLSSTSAMEALRVEYENMLVANSIDSAADEEAVSVVQCKGLPNYHMSFHCLPLLVLALFGIMPFRSGQRVWTWYRCVVLVTIAGLLSYSIAVAVLEEQHLYLHLSASCIVLGGLLGLVFLWTRRVQDLFGPKNKPLVLYTDQCDAMEKWRVISSFRGVVVVAFLVFSVACRSLSDVSCSRASASPLSLLVFAWGSTLLAALVYCHLHVCCGLELAIDSFCTRFFREPDPSRGIVEWNTLQAMLRRGAHTVEACFLAVSTSVLAVVMLTGVEIVNMGSLSSLSRLGGKCEVLWAGWVSPLVALTLYAIFKAAAITEKCSRVPSLVNSWIRRGEGGVEFDHQRQYMVQYIMHSSAGFYVKGVRLSAMWAWKMTYLMGVVVFTLASQSVQGFDGWRSAGHLLRI